jgi:DNA polymerase I
MLNQPTYLLDASLYIFRAYHAREMVWTDPQGWPTHAVHGFTTTLLNLLEKAKPHALAVCFDESFGRNFRHALYPAYKANREPPTEDLVRQFSYCKDVVEALGFCALGNAEYEADDLIGSLVEKLNAAGRAGMIVSADKDLAQLINPTIMQWDFGKGVPFGAAAVKEKHGVEPTQMAQMQALSGDAVDNIPGIPGIGAKTAAALMQHFGTLEAVLTRWPEVEFLRLRGAAATAIKLRDHAASARLSYQLTQVATNAPVPELSQLTRKPLDAKRIDLLFDTLGFGGFLRAKAKRS